MAILVSKVASLQETQGGSVDGVTFGWKLDQFEDGTYQINIEPGSFIAYYEPWDGLGYDT